MDFELNARLFFSSDEKAKNVLKAVKPELDEMKGNRAKTKINLKKNVLSINIKAGDATALRASFNSVMKGIILSLNLLEVH